MIVYDKLFDLLNKRCITVSLLRINKVIGMETYYKMLRREGNVDSRTINKLCKYLRCQPGDIMEYIDDPDEE